MTEPKRNEYHRYFYLKKCIHSFTFRFWAPILSFNLPQPPSCSDACSENSSRLGTPARAQAEWGKAWGACMVLSWFICFASFPSRLLGPDWGRESTWPLALGPAMKRQKDEWVAAGLPSSVRNRCKVSIFENMMPTGTWMAKELSSFLFFSEKFQGHIGVFRKIMLSLFRIRTPK